MPNSSKKRKASGDSADPSKDAIKRKRERKPKPSASIAPTVPSSLADQDARQPASNTAGAVTSGALASGENGAPPAKRAKEANSDLGTAIGSETSDAWRGDRPSALARDDGLTEKTVTPPSGDGQHNLVEATAEADGNSGAGLLSGHVVNEMEESRQSAAGSSEVPGPGSVGANDHVGGQGAAGNEPTVPDQEVAADKPEPGTSEPSVVASKSTSLHAAPENLIAASPSHHILSTRPSPRRTTVVGAARQAGAGHAQRAHPPPGWSGGRGHQCRWDWRYETGGWRVAVPVTHAGGEVFSGTIMRVKSVVCERERGEREGDSSWAESAKMI